MFCKVGSSNLFICLFYIGKLTDTTFDLSVSSLVKFVCSVVLLLLGLAASGPGPVGCVVLCSQVSQLNCLDFVFFCDTFVLFNIIMLYPC